MGGLFVPLWDLTIQAIIAGCNKHLMPQQPKEEIFLPLNVNFTRFHLFIVNFVLIFPSDAMLDSWILLQLENLQF